jgi:flagellar hook-associated protein 3 FlgL
VDNAGPTGHAALLNALSTDNRKITNAHDNVITVRASVGTRLQELDALGDTGDSRALYDKSYLSDLQDLDYASAISEFYQRQTALQASQQTFVQIQQISLFNYL